MKKLTIAQEKINEMQANGYDFICMTSGWPSFRGNSNVSKTLVNLNLSKDDVVIRTGARAGARRTEGWQILIFKKA